MFATIPFNPYRKKFLLLDGKVLDGFSQKYISTL